jgi:predicted transcriptional regulator
MRTTKVLSITLPPALFEQAQALAKEENRTMSELMREALRRYQTERYFEKARSRMAPIAEEMGIHSEEDVVELVRQVRRERSREDPSNTQKTVANTAPIAQELVGAGD